VSAELLLDNSAWARLDHQPLSQNRADELLALARIAVDAQVEARAIDPQRQLARVGHHRPPPVDLPSRCGSSTRSPSSRQPRVAGSARR
jgi:hypothetical protein